MPTEVKTVGPSGQISLGKRHAGRTVTVEELEDGVWLVKAARVVPENELWLHTEPAKSRLDAAVRWAEANEPEEADLDALERKLAER